MTDVSIVIPVYQSAKSIEKTIQTIQEKVLAHNKQYSFEIICVDDGSKDNSYEILKRLWAENKTPLRLVKLSRNFGQAAAILAGYRKSGGKCVINISADMQDPPELMNKMIADFFDEKIQIIAANRINRDEPFFKKGSSKIFYRLLKRLSFPDVPLGGFDYALLGRKVVDIILSKEETNFFWQGQILWTGFPIKYIPYKRTARQAGFGKSSWTVDKKIKLMLDGLLGHAGSPLRPLFILGMLLLVTGILGTPTILLICLFSNLYFSAWMAVSALLLSLFGILFLILGLMSDYLWRILEQTRNRPNYLIEEEY